MNTVYQTLQSCLSGTTLTLPATTFPGGIQDVITEYFGASLVFSNVTLIEQTDGASFANATLDSGPLTGMTVTVTFTQDATEVTLNLAATSPPGWTFATGWPLLAGSWLASVEAGNASFVLSSVAQATASLSKGLNFTGNLTLGSQWTAVAWLLNQQGSFSVAGPIGQQGAVPVFAFSAPLLQPVSIPPFLTSLSLELQVSCAAVSGEVAPLKGDNSGEFVLITGPGPVTYPYVPQATIGLAANLQLTSSLALPLFVDLTTPLDSVAVTANVAEASLVAFTDFVQLLPGIDFTSALPSTSTFDPGSVFTLRTLSFVVSPVAARLTSVEVVLGTTKSWPITDGLSVGPIDLHFQVQPGATNSLAASLVGPVQFPGGALQFGAYYPGFTFAGNLVAGSQIDLTDLMQKLLPIQLSATLLLDELDFTVTPSNGNFSLLTGLSGDWAIPVGVATIDLTNAWLNLERSTAGTADATTTGAITLQGNLALASSTMPFVGSWALPGAFTLQAGLPTIHLTDLAEALSGTTLPTGVPDVSLTNGQVVIALNVTSGDYLFSLAMTADINGESIGTGLFQVRTTSGSTGILAGFVIPQAWSPASIWPELASLLDKLSFTDSGLLISTLPAGQPVTLPNLKMPSLPSTVNPGFVFFSTLSLTGDILGPVSKLFADDIKFNLLAVVDTATPANSVFQAVLPDSQSNGSIRFTGITIVLKPAAASFALSVGAVLTIQNDAITLQGTGLIQLEPPAFSFTIEVANWIQPFGISNLTIQDFGLQVKVEEAGVTLGFLGSFIIGQSPRTFALIIGGEIIDFEAPGAIIFELQNQQPSDPLMLYDLIEQFTQLDLSSVPVLNKIGFNDLEFWVVDDPAGFQIGSYTFPPGIGVVGDIFLYSWEAKFNIQVNFSKGIIASGSINNPITLGGIFSLSDSTGQTGPSGSIDTSAIASLDGTRMLAANTRLSPRGLTAGSTPYISLDGKVSLLGLTESIKAQASGTSFDFNLSYDFLSIVTANLSCSLVDDKNFAASASIAFDLNVTLGPYSVAGITLIPQVTIDGPGAALALAVAINPTVLAELSVGLKFSWASLPLFDLDVTVSLADIGHDLHNLYQAVIQWLQQNVGSVFAKVLADVAEWVDALKNVFNAIGQDIDQVADALANYFSTGASDAAAYLKDLGFEFESIVSALFTYFKIAYEEAYHIVEALYNDCSMSYAFQQATAPHLPSISVRELHYQLATSEKGQRMLLVTYAHGAEIWALLRQHPHLQQQLRAHYKSPRGASDLRKLIHINLAVLTTVVPHASPLLRAHINVIISQLYAARHYSHRQFINFLNL